METKNTLTDRMLEFSQTYFAGPDSLELDKQASFRSLDQSLAGKVPDQGAWPAHGKRFVRYDWHSKGIPELNSPLSG